MPWSVQRNRGQYGSVGCLLWLEEILQSIALESFFFKIKKGGEKNPEWRNKSCVPSLRRLRLIYDAENLNKNRRKLLGEYVFETLQL